MRANDPAARHRTPAALGFTCVVLLVTACARTPPSGGFLDPTTGVRVIVHATDRHSSLRDHERALTIVAPDGGTAHRALYPCNGGAAPANLYRGADGGLVLVDLNGVWIEIDGTGGIRSSTWRWQEPLPTNALGAFREGDDGEYRLSQPTEEHIYRFKEAP